MERACDVPGRVDAQARDRRDAADPPRAAAGAGQPPRPAVPGMLIPSDNEAANRMLVMLGGSTSGGGALVNATMRVDRPRAHRDVRRLHPRHSLATGADTRHRRARRAARRRRAAAWGIGKSTTALDLARLFRAIWLGSGGLGPLDRTGVSPAGGAIPPLRARARARPREARPPRRQAPGRRPHAQGRLGERGAPRRGARRVAGRRVRRRRDDASRRTAASLGRVADAASAVPRLSSRLAASVHRGRRPFAGRLPSRAERGRGKSREGAGRRPRYEPASALGVRCLPILRSAGGGLGSLNGSCPIGADI